MCVPWANNVNVCCRYNLGSTLKSWRHRKLKWLGCQKHISGCHFSIDEIAIKEEISYNPATDTIEGITSTGTIANHAMVFMVRGLMTKCKQPVGYHLSCSTMDPSTMKTYLLECIGHLHSAGLTVKIIVCDQGANNRSLLHKHLQVSTSKPFLSFPREQNFMYI